MAEDHEGGGKWGASIPLEKVYPPPTGEGVGGEGVLLPIFFFKISSLKMLRVHF